MKSFLEMIQEPRIPAPELKMSYVGVEAKTIFQNNLVDFKIRQERKKFKSYRGGFGR